jgi:L-histidine Nalpha-methyltransferase
MLKTVAQDKLKAVINGMTAIDKYLPSWLFYDEVGDALFQQITQLPEYYLSRSETEILEKYSKNIASLLRESGKEWDVIELGPGDGTKTKILLNAFVRAEVDVHYFAIDVSENILGQLENDFRVSLPEVPLTTLSLEYFEGLDQINRSNSRAKLVLFMGANVGNFEVHQAEGFLKSICAKLNKEDYLMVSFDQIKDPALITAAYNDSEGITARFNLNLLSRLNREYNGNFKVENFKHYPTYDPVTGSARSYLISRKKHDVFLKDISLEISFDKWEPIYTEVSQKYSKGMIDIIASNSGLKGINSFTDSSKYLTLDLFVRGSFPQ